MTGLTRRAGMCACSHSPAAHHAARGCLVVACACRALTVKPRRQKYNAQRCAGPLGELYDSKLERDYADVLRDRRATGQIEDWKWSPRFVLQDEPLITVRWDFLVVPKMNRSFYVVDVKSRPTAQARDFSLRVRLWKSRFPSVPIAAVIDGVEEWL